MHSPESHGIEGAHWHGRNAAITIFRSLARPKNSRRSIFEAHSRTAKERPSNGAPPKRAPSRRWAAFLAKYRPDAFPKEPRTVKTPLRGKISPPCIQNELVLARYALHVFKMPRKTPFGNTPREYLAAKGPFSLRGPLESRMANESCHSPGSFRWTDLGMLSDSAKRVSPGPTGLAWRILLHDTSHRENLATFCGERFDGHSRQPHEERGAIPYVQTHSSKPPEAMPP